MKIIGFLAPKKLYSKIGRKCDFPSGGPEEKREAKMLKLLAMLIEIPHILSAFTDTVYIFFLFSEEKGRKFSEFHSTIDSYNHLNNW